MHSPQRLSSAAAPAAWGRSCLVGASLECDLQLATSWQNRGRELAYSVRAEYSWNTRGDGQASP